MNGVRVLTMVSCSHDQNRRHLIWAACILGVLVIAGVVMTLTGHLQKLSCKMFEIFQSREQLRIYLESWGGWGPAIFIWLQALQVVIAPVPGELTGVVGGFVFGTTPSVAYSTVGLTVGSMVAFLVARIIGLPFVRLVVTQETLNRFHFVTERKGIVYSLVLFIVPGFPKDILCYLLGLSSMSFLSFILVCGLGRIPGTVMLSFSGAAVYDEDWRLLAILIIVCAACLAAFYFKGEKSYLWLGSRCRGNLTSEDQKSPAESASRNSQGPC